MMRTRILLYAVAFFVAMPVLAQRSPIEPDDFVDPAMRNGSLYLLRVATGVVANPSDRYRPSRGNAGFILITNSFYAGRFQFDYKHVEFAAEDDPPRVQRCDCPDPVYFPTAPPGNATPTLPPPGRSDTLQASFYRTAGRSTDTPVTLRYRVSVTGEPTDTVVTSASTGEVVERHSGYDRSFTFDADTHFRLGRYSLWGTVYFAQTSRTNSGTGPDRTQNELAYVSRLPGWAAGPVLFRPKLTIGGITGRGGPGLNLVNPYLEAYWRHERTKVNFHLAWSAEGTRSGAEGWRTNHQVAIFLDRTLWVKSFGGPR
jgi:hypothetical protein